MYVSITNTEGVMAILMISSSRGGHIGFVLMEQGPGPLAHLAKPMVIESKYMSLSQIQKELLPFLCFHEVAAAILDLVYWKILGAQVPITPLAMPMAIDSKCMSLSQNTEGVMAILMIS